MGYDVFISYSHAGDDLLSERVQGGLQRLAKPWWQRRALTVFRDQTALSANPGLWSSIATAIDDSRYFILLACPESAASDWVAREVVQWRADHGSQNLLVLLTRGDLVWDAQTNDYDWTATTALSASAFAGCFTEEPRHVDMRWARSEEQLDLRNGRFRDQVAELASPVRGMAKDELAGADVREHRRTLRHAYAAVIALVVLTIASIAAFATSVFAVNAAATARRDDAHVRAAQHLADVQKGLALIASERATKSKLLAQERGAEANQQRALAESRARDLAAANAHLDAANKRCSSAP